MTIAKLKSLCVKKETTFNASAFANLFEAGTRLAAEGISWKPTQEWLDRAVQLDQLGEVPGVIGGKGGTITFKVGLTAGGLGTTSLDLGTVMFSGVGLTAAGQVMTTGDAQTMTLNQCAGMWLVPHLATSAPMLIVSNTAVTAAPAVLTVLGTAATDAGAYSIVKPAAVSDGASDSSAAAAATVADPLLTCMLGSSMQTAGSRGTKLDAAAPGSTSAPTLNNTTQPAALGFGTLAAGVPTGSLFFARGSPLQVRYITSASGSPTLAISPPLSGVPVINEQAYGSAMFWPSDEGNAETVSFIAQGDGYQYTFTGCRGTPPKITGASGKRVMLDFKFEVTSWTVTSLTASGTPALPDLHTPLLALGSPFFWGPSGTTVPIADFEFDWGMAIAAKRTTEDADGKAGWIATALKPVLKVKPYFATSWQTDFAAGTVQLALLQIGSVAGKAVVLCLPAAQLMKYPDETDLGGYVGSDVEFLGTLGPTGIPGTTEPTSPAFLAFI